MDGSFYGNDWSFPQPRQQGIRRPTSEADALLWWRRSVSGERVARIEDEPQCGFFKARMVRGGPFVGVAIWLEQDIDPETGELTAPEEMRAMMNGRMTDPIRAWNFARPISREEYDALTGIRDRVEEMAATHVAIDLGRMAAIRP